MAVSDLEVAMQNPRTGSFPKNVGAETNTKSEARFSHLDENVSFQLLVMANPILPHHSLVRAEL